MTVGVGLVRTIGRWTLTGLILNNIIGSGIFGVPAEVAGKLGRLAPLAWVLAALVMGIIVACIAEVSSRFDSTGGPYLYARVAFGGLIGAELGWISYLVRVTSAAANVNLFANYLAELWPGAAEPLVRAAVIVAFFGGLAALNYRGVRQGAAMSNLFIVGKLIPLLTLGVVGLVVVASRGPVVPAYSVEPDARAWLDAGILLVYAYGGFEATLVAAGEARNPQRDTPLALGGAILAAIGVYLLVQMVVIWTLPDAPSQTRPLAAAARALMGSAGATLLAFGALLSVYGWGTAALVAGPRVTYAMAEQGDLAPLFGRIHPRFRTPAVSILTYALVATLLALSGTFLKNLTVASIARMLMYASICLTLPLFRRREGHDPRVARAWFRLPGGPALSWVGAAVCFGLMTRMNQRDALIIGVTLLFGLVNWYLIRRRPAAT